MTDGECTLVTEFSMPSALGNERVVMDRVAAALVDRSLEPAQLDRLKTAVAEAAMNAIEHGNRNDPALSVDVRVDASHSGVRVAITDHGGLREIADPPAPDIEAKLAGVQSTRGWGLFLIEHMVDDVRTTSDGERRTVELVIRTPAVGDQGGLADQYGRSSH